MGKPSKTVHLAPPPKYETRPSLLAARPFGKELPQKYSIYDSFATIIATISGFGMILSNPVFNWVALFILISLYINRGRTRTAVSQTWISLITCVCTTLFLYYRLRHGLTTKQ